MDDSASKPHDPPRQKDPEGRLLTFRPSLGHRKSEPTFLRQRLDELINLRQAPGTDGPRVDPRLSLVPLLA